MFLGIKTSEKGIEPDLGRILEIEDKTPTTKRKLRSFLGFANRYRQFVPKISELTCKLKNKIKKKNKEFHWNIEYEDRKVKIIDAIKKFTKL
ncbi:TF29 [Hepatospora eriocheir]|uniref:TF29 n=1 Tax=Hepatospora eriocheir TaxID=1081669 RepID=A0A1X0Q7X2_9MICR|nr:TF29 [Hepatospora eriocheir]